MANMNVETVEKMSNIADVGSGSTPTLEGGKTDHCVSSESSVMKISIIHRVMTMAMVTALGVEVWGNILTVRKEKTMQVVGQQDNTEDIYVKVCISTTCVLNLTIDRKGSNFVEVSDLI